MKSKIISTFLMFLFVAMIGLPVQAQSDRISPELQEHMSYTLKQARELRKMSDPKEGLKKLMEAIHPSLLAAKLLEEQIVKNGPIIQDYLRRTRYAISDQYHNDPLSPKKDPYSFITLNSDRAAVKRNLKHIEDFIDGISKAYSDYDKRQYIQGIQESLDRIERIYANYGVNFQGQDLIGNANESAGVVSLKSGDWNGWGVMKISKAGGKFKGTYSATYVKQKLGTIEIYFDGVEWKGTWGEPAIGRKGDLYDISVNATGTEVSGKYNVTVDGGKGFKEDVPFTFTFEK